MMKTIQGYTYKINQNIGKGFSSTVHKGIKQLTGQSVSIKVIEMAKLQDPINQMLLQHQITALKKLTQSTNVLHFYDVYATKNNTYIITELCDGDLGSLLKKRKNIPYPQAVQIIRQIMCGYMDIYRIGYLHRDIKPANIFYKGNSYKVGDFGFAIPSFEVENHKNYNVGSPVYMPPEALKDNKYGVSCDTWAIGIIFFQMIKGVVPWRAISEQKLHEKLITEPLQKLTEGLPEIARSFLAKVLHLDPQQRMSIEEMTSWHIRLNSVQIRSLNEPLREIKNQNRSQLMMETKNNVMFTPKEVPSSTIVINHSPNPKLKSVRTNSDRQYFHKNSGSQLQIKNQNSPIQKEVVYKQATEFSENLINYLRFVHRILKFIGAPNQIQLFQIQDSLTNHLHQQLENIDQLIHIPSITSAEKWESFIKSQKGISFKKKVTKYRAKYRMFHPQKKYSILTEEKIKYAIGEILRHLEDQSKFNEKSVIAADYLTTMFQLLDLKEKYSLPQFLKVSKIEIIMQGNPYSASKEHLAQLKKKITLLDI